MMKKRAFVISIGVSATLGVGACGVDTLFREMAGGFSLGSSILGSDGLSGDLDFGAGGLSVAGACSTFAYEDIEYGREQMQGFRNAGYSLEESQAEVFDTCQGPDVPPGPLEDCIACGFAIASEVYYGGF